jgi:XTP/dITP diphosphohydrolase
MGQPALSLTAKLLGRARRAGVQVPLPEPAPLPPEPTEDEVGELLLAVVAAAGAGVDPEAALRAAARRYAEAVRATE